MEVKECNNKEKKADKRKRVHLLERIMREQKAGKGISKYSFLRRLTLPSTNFYLHDNYRICHYLSIYEYCTTVGQTFGVSDIL